MEYNYSISADSGTGKIWPATLAKEVGVSSIGPTLESISTNGDLLIFKFVSALSAEEVTTLSAVLGAHQGIEVEESETITYNVELLDKQVEPVKGNGDFETFISHDFTDDASTYTLEPSSATIYRLEKAEVQFSHDIKLAGKTPTPAVMHFDVWAYNPLFDAGQTPTAEDPTFVPGVSSGNPLRFLVERQTYNSIRDVLNKGNAHYTIPYALDDMSNGMSTVQFNYPKWIELKSSQGAQIRVEIENGPMGGEFCTVSFLVSKASE